MKKSRKLLSGIIAIGIVTASVVPLSANAYNLSIAPTSAFTYDLSAKIISDSQIAVTYYSTYNPGLTSIAVRLNYDPAVCSFDKCVRNNEVNEAFLLEIENNSTDGAVVCASTVLPDQHDAQKKYDYTGDIKYTFYFDINEAVEVNDDFKFSAFVYGYKSQTENINVDCIENLGTRIDTEFDIQASQYEYTIGDVNNDGYINLNDASCIMDIISACESISLTSTVENVNYYVNTDKLVYETTWSDRFSYLIREGTSCAETADADIDGTIEQSDSEDVLDYYSYIGSNISTEDLIVGTTGFKLVFANVTA